LGIKYICIYNFGVSGGFIYQTMDKKQRASEVERHKIVEKFLKEQKKEYERYLEEPKLLILGSSDSGKSTLLKQMKIMHGSGFTSEEKRIGREHMRKNIVVAIYTILSKVRDSCTSDIETIQPMVQRLNEDVQEKQKSFLYSPEDVELLKRAWAIGTVKDTFQSETIDLPDTTE
jgi:hypothetical protein